MKKYLIIFIFIFFTKPAISQTFHIGATTGYSRGYIATQPYFKNFFENTGGNRISLSFYADYKPKSPILNINSSLTIQTYFKDNSTFCFLKIPWGIDFVIGKKYQVQERKQKK
jgi:hypothetical protein